ncbi:eukaryotic translation initiation factor 4 gamma 1-like isoform X2 [Engraulis encrasicolus]|uniref:eukaryotic translation initiation factor 4 gamma 1-like isoform X2 n=1 Tax=Engraulis encrasicolus TaxID=184585 RepID=UPI002FD754EC
MNKAPQPLTGPPPTAPPHPTAPSPGLSQPGFPPQQPSVVFATPPPMNPGQQPPRQPYYQGGRPSLPSGAGRVQTPSSAPRQVPPHHGTHPAHVYQPNPSQVMMIPQQPFPIANSPSPAAYFIPGPGQYRTPYSVPAPQQYQVAGSPGFYPGTSPGDYAGAYYPAQPQFPPPVQQAPVLMNPAPQQPQAPPTQQPQAPPKRERKQIRIRDPNQGGRDITEEIMSGTGFRSASTPTPPQTSPEGGAANGENAPPAAVAPRTESKAKSPPPRPVLQSQEVPIPPGEDLMPEAPPTPPPTSPISDTVDAPPPPVALAKTKPQDMPATAPLAKGKPEDAVASKEAVSIAAPLESPIVQPEELTLYNGAAPSAAHVSPLAEPDTQAEAPTPAAPAPKQAKEATKDVAKETSKESPAAVAKDAPVVKDTPAPVVKETVAPVVKETVAPVVKETVAPVVKETVAPVVKETVAPVVKETPPAVVKETPAPVAKEMPAPVTKETPAPVVKEAPAPVVKETAPLVVKEAPAAVVKETTPVVKDTTPAVVKGTPAVVKDTAAVVKDAAPVVKETPPVVVEPPPAVKELPPAVVKETPAPVVTDTPAPIVKETPAPVVKETQAAAKETLEPAAKEPAAATKVLAPDAGSTLDKPVAQATLPESTPPVVKEAPKAVITETQADVTDGPTPTPTPAEDREDTPPTQPPAPESTMQAAIAVPKKRKKIKELNKKEMVGDLLDAFKETVPPPEPEKATPPPPKEIVQPPVAPPAEEVDETWEEKEDKLDAENIQPRRSPSATPSDNSQSQRASSTVPNENNQPQRSSTPSTPTEQKYQYKEEQWKPLNPEAKKRYDREFLLTFQFTGPSMNKPEGLPPISDVVLDKANKMPLRQLDPARLPGMNMGPDFTPSFANLGRQSSGGRGPPSAGGLGGPRRSGQGMRKEPRKIIASVSLGEDVQLNKAEKAWKPTVKRGAGAGRGAGPAAEEEASGAESAEDRQTEELFKRVRSVLNKLTPQMFQPLMKQITEMTIDTEVRLKGVIDLVFEKAISEPNFSVAYANMCRCLMGLKVPMADKPSVTVNFRKLLLNRCQKEFEKDKDDDEIFERKQKELDASAVEEEKQRLREELEEAKDAARRRSLGNIKFIGELFKLKMLTEPIMHDCIVKLLKNHDEESLECLCRLLSTIGKDLDFEKAKPRMDQYFTQMEKVIKERKTSSRIRFMLQDVLDLRRCNWVPRRGDQGPKTIKEIHKEAELEEAREQVKVQQQLMNKKEVGGPVGRGGRGGGHTGHSGGQRPNNQAPDEGWNTVPISTKNRSIDPSRLTKITKTGALDLNTTLLAPGGKGMWGSWGKGSSGGTGAKPQEPVQDTSRTSTLNRFSALQQPSSSAPDSDRRAPQRNSSSRERGGERFERLDRGGERYDRRDERGGADRDRRRDDRSREDRRRGDERSREDRHRGGAAMGKGSFSREREQRPTEGMRRVASGSLQSERGSRERGSRERGSRERGSRERAVSKDSVKRETAPTPPPPAKAALSEEELEKKSNAIIEEYLHINDLKEALQCVSELQCDSVLNVFVRTGIEATLERSSKARESMGGLLHQLVKAGTLSTTQYYKGVNEILEVAEDMEIDIPHIWLYLGELITPMLQEGGIPMGTLFREVAKPLQPMGKAGVLLAQILSVLSKGMSHKKISGLWLEGGLNWRDFLPEDEDVNKFVTEKAVEYTLGAGPVKEKEAGPLSPQKLREELERLLQDKPDNQRITDWVEANLDEKQVASNAFVRALMIAVCQAAVICEKPYKVDTEQVIQRAVLLQRYLKDEEKELQALYALQSLMVQLEQPPNVLRMFFDVLYDEDVVKEEAFYRWESSKDVAEQVGKGVALKSVTAFFTWLREAEDESDNS